MKKDVVEIIETGIGGYRIVSGNAQSKETFASLEEAQEMIERHSAYPFAPEDEPEPPGYATLIVSGHGGRNGSMCDDGEIVVSDGEPYRVICDHPDGWVVTGNPMSRRVLAELMDWDDVSDDEVADDIICD